MRLRPKQPVPVTVARDVLYADDCQDSSLAGQILVRAGLEGVVISFDPDSKLADVEFNDGERFRTELHWDELVVRDPDAVQAG